MEFLAYIAYLLAARAKSAAAAINADLQALKQRIADPGYLEVVELGFTIENGQLCQIIQGEVVDPGYEDLEELGFSIVDGSLCQVYPA